VHPNKSQKLLLSGGLFYTPEGWIHPESSEETLLKLKPIKTFAPIHNSNWYLATFLSERALIDPDVENPPFEYPIYYRQSSRRALILSPRKSIVDEFLRLVCTKNNLPSLEAVYIDVQRLVQAIRSEPGRYAVTYLHARTSGLGSSLKSLSFYGEDVTGASLYRAHAQSLLSHTCGLRDVYADKRSLTEAVRVSSEGSVSFYFSNHEDLGAAEKAIGFMFKNGFLLEPRGEGPRTQLGTENDFQQEQE